MLESYLIEHCSPTLASLKSGSLFSCKCTSEDDIEKWVSEWNDKLRSRGVSIRLLRRTSRTALIYVYRHSALEEALSDSGIREFLNSCGYDACYCCNGCTADSCSIDNCLKHLESRINVSSVRGDFRFPHEIGLFLGYPLADVMGFIRNKGRDFKCVGTWKVYDDVSSAQKSFERFAKCNNVYSKLWKSGRRSVLQLTVAG